MTVQLKTYYVPTQLNPIEMRARFWTTVQLCLVCIVHKLGQVVLSLELLVSSIAIGALRATKLIFGGGGGGGCIKS